MGQGEGCQNGAMTDRVRPDSSRGDGTREALLRAAVAVVRSEGLPAMTTRRVAAEANLPHGAVHYWFADKSDLVRAVLHVMLGDVRAAILSDGSITDFDERLTRISERFAAMPEGQLLGLFEVTLAAVRKPALRPFAHEQYAAYQSATEESLSGAAHDVDEVLPGGARALGTLIIAVLDGLTLAALTSPDPTDLEAARHLFAFLVTSAIDQSA